jgi:hypothetical protein
VLILSGGESDTFDSGTITAKKYLWVQCFNKASGQIDTGLNFNSDTGNTYSWRQSTDGAGDTTDVSASNINLDAGSPTNVGSFHNIFIINNLANEKLVINHNVSSATAGAGTAPKRMESVGKWANTSAQITSIQMKNFGTGSFGTASIMKVWGAN